MKFRNFLTLFAVSGIALAGFFATTSSASRASERDQPVTPAPIESVEVVPSGSAPTGNALKVVAGLPNGCAEPYVADHLRFGATFFAYVLNTQPASDDVACTMMYRTYEVTIDLGTDFVPGKEYTAYVNGTPITFVAHGGIVPPDRVEVEAPIELMDIVAMPSDPSHYTAEIVAVLPNGCAEPGSHELTQDGTYIPIDVLNTMPAGDPICTDIYRTYSLSVDLGDDLVSGELYTVDVNGTTVSFVAY